MSISIVCNHTEILIYACKHPIPVIAVYIYSYSWPAQPDNPYMIRVASINAFSVCLLSVLYLSVLCSLLHFF